MREVEYDKSVTICRLKTEDYERCLRKVNKLALNSIDEKRKYIKNTESFPWEKQI